MRSASCALVARILLDNIDVQTEQGWLIFTTLLDQFEPDQRPPQISKTSTLQELETYLERARLRRCRSRPAGPRPAGHLLGHETRSRIWMPPGPLPEERRSPAYVPDTPKPGPGFPVERMSPSSNCAVSCTDCSGKMALNQIETHADHGRSRVTPFANFDREWLGSR